MCDVSGSTGPGGTGAPLAPPPPLASYGSAKAFGPKSNPVQDTE